MAPAQPSFFRFRDPPGEIRNKVYHELLCVFEPRPTTMDPSNVITFAPARHDIDTSILRTSKAIYREAYDVLMKTKRFVTITSARGLPVRFILNDLQVSITVAPLLAEHKPATGTPLLRDFFSETTQKGLLAPFRKQLRGYKAVKIQGYVNKDLATAVRSGMSQDRWSDYKQILADFRAAKEQGSQLFQQRRPDDGCLIWQDAAVDIEKIPASTSWPILVERGGEPFISQLAELYFLTRLNVAHVKITAMQKSTYAYYEGIMAEDTLTMATRSLNEDYWMRGYKYRLSDRHLAKMRYRFALVIRLQGEPGTADRALSHIEGALRLQPGDAAIVREKDNILAWTRQGY